MKYTWKNENNTILHYVRNCDGRIMGTIWQYVGNSFTWTSKIYIEDFPFTSASEQYIGHYASQDTAKVSVENYWFQQELTLENKR